MVLLKNFAQLRKPSTKQKDNLQNWYLQWYIRKLPQASYPHPSEDRQNENHNHRKLTKLITWFTALSNSVKLWAMPCGATEDGPAMVESSDKMGEGEGKGKPLQYSSVFFPLEKGKANHFSILALRTPWTL